MHQNQLKLESLPTLFPVPSTWLGKRPRGLFLERPGKLTGPVAYFEIEVSRKVGCILTSNEVHFVSLAENFTVQFLKVLKLPPGMENKNSSTGPVINGSF